MKIDAAEFQIHEDRKVDLGKRPTRVKPLYESDADYERLLAKQVSDLQRLQHLLYAQDRYSLLLIFQAMDAAGKDGAIKHVMSGVNPQGCQVFSFRHPGPEELDHDFLWRTTRALPERGRIGIFNRSYYEEVLIVRVHPELLRAQNLPHERLDRKSIWKERYRSITDLEDHLHRNGTRVIKFFLHLSKEEQCRRFIARIDDPEKNWKFNAADAEERKYWKDYMKAYEACLGATSTRTAPWYAVPADDKKNARLIIAAVIVDALKALGMSYPAVTPAHRRALRSIRRQLAERGGRGRN